MTIERSIIPLPMVFATWVPRTKAATKLKNAAQATACCGESTRVETTVAIEFAASWKPFRKSKISATTMMAMRTVMAGRRTPAQAFLITTLPMMWVKSLQESQASSRFW